MFPLCFPCIFHSGYWVVGVSFSVLPPIYPEEAESKGASPSQYGFVFGITYLAALCSSERRKKSGQNMLAKCSLHVKKLNFVLAYFFKKKLKFALEYFSAPFWTAWTESIGPKRVLVGSMVVRSLAGGVLFGLLHFIYSVDMFVGLSYILR